MAQIWHCYGVVWAISCSSDLIPHLGTSICHRCGLKKKKQTNKTKSEMDSGQTVYATRMQACPLLSNQLCKASSTTIPEWFSVFCLSSSTGPARESEACYPKLTWGTPPPVTLPLDPPASSLPTAIRMQPFSHYIVFYSLPAFESLTGMCWWLSPLL